MVDSFPDPLNDRVMKEVLPPPHKPLEHSKLFPKKSKSVNLIFIQICLIGNSYVITLQGKGN